MGVPLLELKTWEDLGFIFWNMLMPCSRSSGIDETDLKVVSERDFSSTSELYAEIPRNNIIHKRLLFVLALLWINWWVWNKEWWFYGGTLDTFTSSTIKVMKAFGMFGKGRLKTTSSLWILIFLQSFLPFPLFKFKVNMDFANPQKSLGIFPHLLDSPCRA